MAKTQWLRMDEKKHNIAFGAELRLLRKAKKWSQDELAFESGLDRTYISLLELGQRSPTLDTIMKLCDALCVSLSDIAGAIEDRMDHEH